MGSWYYISLYEITIFFFPFHQRPYSNMIFFLMYEILICKRFYNLACFYLAFFGFLCIAFFYFNVFSHLSCSSYLSFSFNLFFFLFLLSEKECVFSFLVKFHLFLKAFNANSHGKELTMKFYKFKIAL